MPQIAKTVENVKRGAYKSGNNFFITPETFPLLLPPRLLCSDNLQHGSWRAPQPTALDARYLQVNGRHSQQAIVLDLDYAGAAVAWEDALLPRPTWGAGNLNHVGAHLAWVLRTPVATHSACRQAPLRKLAAAERGLQKMLNADRAYAAWLTKNPVHSSYRTEWGGEVFDLDYLMDFIPDELMLPEREPERSTGCGRNVQLFDDVRQIAYREMRQHKRNGGSFELWRERIINITSGANQQFVGHHVRRADGRTNSGPLPISEVRAIATSIAKWTWRNFTDERYAKFVTKQKERSHLGNQIRTAARWGRHVAESTTKPWEAMGISRRTYYRRKAANQLATS